MSKIHTLVSQWKARGLLLPIWMEGDRLCLIDQRRLPHVEEILTVDEVPLLAELINSMAIRGSGAIGISGAYGMLLACRKSGGDRQAILAAGRLLRETRSTALNLLKTVDELTDRICAYGGADLADFVEEHVCDILQRQLRYEENLGSYGAERLFDGDSVLTHCHSGAMAGSGYGGRALSVIRKAHEQGKRIHVYVCETRPYLQGARITAYELGKFGIPHTLITDGMSGYLMRLGKIHKVVVGSDRIAANGDLINKVGTYMHALAAAANGLPFYTASSTHTIDFTLANGMDIPVEYRSGEDVTHMAGIPIAAPGTKAIYPSFDVTPNELIGGIITERGIIEPSYVENLKQLIPHGKEREQCL